MHSFRDLLCKLSRCMLVLKVEWGMEFYQEDLTAVKKPMLSYLNEETLQFYLVTLIPEPQTLHTHIMVTYFKVPEQLGVGRLL